MQKTAPESETAQTPLTLLKPYQKRFVLDGTRYKIISCARQCGKSTMFACEAAMDCVRQNGTSWLCVSAGQRQASEWLEKARIWAEDWIEFMSAKGAKTKITAASKSELRFSNGSRIIALPPNPETIRGYTANVILDEFAYHEHADRVWQAIIPSITSELRSKLKVRIGSTVAGKQNMFWKLLERAKTAEGWSSYTVTVNQAQADGLKIDIEVLRQGISDPDIWAQEYMCQPVDASSALLTYEDITACESIAASEHFDDAEMDEAGKRFAIGMDIGRQHDLTVLWTVEVGVNNKLTTRQVLVLERLPLAEQERILFDKLRRRNLQHVCIDGTGIGYQMAENAVREFGASKVTQFMFTEQSKRDLFLNLQGAFQKREIAVPCADKIREDLHSMQRLFTSSGKVLFSAPSNADGHADRATACALAIEASKKGAALSVGSVSPTPDRWARHLSEDELLDQVFNPQYL